MTGVVLITVWKTSEGDIVKVKAFLCWFILRTTFILTFFFFFFVKNTFSKQLVCGVTCPHPKINNDAR